MTTPNKDDMLRKVRALLAKAEAEGVTAQEAEALTAKAAELMAKYGIDKAVAEARAGHKHLPGNRVFDISNPWGQVKAHLLGGIAGALGCQCVLLHGSRSHKQADIDSRVHVFGYEDDIAQTDLLYTSLLFQMASALRYARVPEGAHSPRAWRRSFLLGFTTAVVLRVRNAYEIAKQESEASGTGAELVLADRSLCVKQALRDAYPATRRTRITYSGRGYNQGNAAGQRANIHDRSGVGTGSRALPR